MTRKEPPKKMSDEAKAQVSAAKKAWWAKKKAEGYIQPTAGKKRDAAFSAKVSAGLKKHYEKNPDAAKKSAAHRDAIRRGKLEYEAQFEEVSCVGVGCPEKTRHHLELCKEHLKLRVRANAYKTTVQKLTQIYEDQDGKCAICPKHLKLYGHPSRVDTNVRAVIDHDHATNVVRGILCSNCNTSIGLAGDSLETLQKAIAYLTKIRDLDATVT